MLDKELWQRLPLEESAEAPNLKAAMEATSREATAAVPSQEEADFEAWRSHGNPWARQTSGAAPGSNINPPIAMLGRDWPGLLPQTLNILQPRRLCISQDVCFWPSWRPH